MDVEVPANGDAAGEAPPYATPTAWTRFVAKTIPTRRHLIWTGAVADDGYGRFHDLDYIDATGEQRSGIVRVSRWMWWAWYGPIPAHLVVMHRCDLPICTRLECLQLGTQSANLLMAAGRDRVARFGVGGRQDLADRRGQAAQSRAVRDAVRAAVAAGVTDPDRLDGVVRATVVAGNPLQDQLPLFDIE